MFEVRLHGALWKQVSPRRADEWRRALDELNSHNGIAFADGSPCEDAAVELVCPPDGSYIVRTWTDGIRPGASVTLDARPLAEHFDEYGTTIRQMVHVDREAPVRGFEALDYAKRVVHDEAAAFISESLASLLTMDLADARRLFTLVFLVGTDIPEELVRYHRMH